MPADTFERDRRSMLESGRPSSGADLDGMAIDFDTYLEMSDEIDPKSISVRKTGDPRRMLQVTCRPAKGRSRDDVVEAVVEVWLERLRYSGREAHRVTTKDDGATVEFATQSGEDGLVVTGTVEVVGG